MKSELRLLALAAILAMAIPTMGLCGVLYWHILVRADVNPTFAAFMSVAVFGGILAVFFLALEHLRHKG